MLRQMYFRDILQEECTVYNLVLNASFPFEIYIGRASTRDNSNKKHLNRPNKSNPSTPCSPDGLEVVTHGRISAKWKKKIG